MIKKFKPEKIKENMKIKTELKRSYLFIFLVVALLAAGFLTVYAKDSNPDNDPSKPPIFGHSADEVDILNVDRAGNPVPYSLQKQLNDVPGKAICSLTAKQLRDDGCPAGSYLYRAKYISPSAIGEPGDAFCKYFYSITDNSASPPACYDTFGNEMEMPCGGWVDEPFPHRVYCN